MIVFPAQPLAYAPDAEAGVFNPKLPARGVPVSNLVKRLLNRPVLNDANELLGFMSIEEGGQLLVGRWVGHCTPDTVVTGMRAAIELLTVNPCRAILSDGSCATGDWSDLVPWMQYDMLPRLIATGVRYVANVRSSDPAGRLAHQQYAQHAAQYLTIRLFDQLEPARIWLREMLAGALAPPRLGAA